MNLHFSFHGLSGLQAFWSFLPPATIYLPRRNQRKARKAAKIRHRHQRCRHGR